MSTSLYGELSQLIGNYGIAAVHKTLESMMEETYLYLQKHYDGRKVTPTVEEEQEEAPPQNHIVYLPTPAEKKIKKVKKAETHVPSDNEEPYMPPPFLQDSDDETKTLTLHNIHHYVPPHDEENQPNLLTYFDTHGHFPTEGNEGADNQSTTSSEKRAAAFQAIDPALRKQQQQDAEKKKRAELDTQGITAESLLTEANLRKWVEDEGRTYSYIARNYVGCPDTLVSSVAKKFGLKSKISKRRIMTIAASKKKA
jgi:hypothetical protein